MHFAGLPKLPSPFSAETQKNLERLQRMDAQAKALERLATDPYREMIEQAIEEERLADQADWRGECLDPIPDDWRPESVDRTLRDEEEKEQWDERYLALHKEAEESRAKQAQAANRLNTNLLNQQQSNKRSLSKQMTGMEDRILGGLDIAFERITATQTWDFHEAEANAEFQREVRTFMDHCMSELQSMNKRIDRLQR